MTHPHAPNTPPPKRGIRPSAWAIIALAAVAVAATAYLFWPTQSSPGELADAARQECGDDKRGFAVGDDGQSLTIDVAGTDDAYGLPAGSLDCVLDVIGVPDSVRSRMLVSKVLDGPQSADWDGYAATWTQRLGMGLTITIEQT